MGPDEFIKAYERALGTQDWNAVEPLMHCNLCAVSSNGTSHEGRTAVQEAFTRNFSLITDEKYAMTNVRWVERNDRFAVFLFDYAWSGLIDGKPASGGGCGSGVIVCEDGRWQLLLEHLAPKSA